MLRNSNVFKPSLRPLHEVPVLIALLAAILCLYSGWVTPYPLSSFEAGAVLTLFAALLLARAVGLARAWRYRSVLCHKRSLPLSCCPPTRNSLYIGRGFVWSGEHSRRALEIERARSIGLVKSGDLSAGDPMLHGLGLFEEREIRAKPLDFLGHALVLGSTRSGKSRLAEILIGQQIHSGDTVIYLDPKGDEDLALRMFHECGRAGRESDFIFLHLRHWRESARHNPLEQAQTSADVATRVVAGLSRGGDNDAFVGIAWGYVDLAVRVLLRLGRQPTYRLIAEVLRRPRDFLAPESEKSREFDELRIFSNRHEEIRTKLLPSLLSLLSQLNAPGLEGILSPSYGDSDDRRPLLNWRAAVRQGAVVYIGTDALGNAEIARIVGSALLAAVTSVVSELYLFGSERGFPAAGRGRQTAPPIRMHIDEFGEALSEEVLQLVNKGAGAGVDVFAYSQTLWDLHVGSGSRDRGLQLLGNFNNLISLRLRDEETAAAFCSHLQEAPMETRSSGSSTVSRGAAFFTSDQEQQGEIWRPLLPPQYLMSLPQGEGFWWSGASLRKLRFPFLKPLRESFDDLRRHLWKSYVRA